MDDRPGPVILLGSGETSASGRRIWEWLFQRLPRPPRVAILETPAGFQPNSAQVAGRIAGFLRRNLQNHRPAVRIVPARARGTPFSPDDPEVLRPLLEADAIFVGPGSPTYALRQLEGSLAWELLSARQQAGAAVVLASAGAIAAGASCLPVYEIYKAGEELHWRRGLGLLAPYGLNPTFVPHWNNSDGGVELDTSHCLMGAERFGRLLELLPADATVVGIDEHTALIVDLAERSFRVMGQGGVRVPPGRAAQIRRGSETREFADSFPPRA